MQGKVIVVLWCGRNVMCTLRGFTQTRTSGRLKWPRPRSFFKLHFYQSSWGNFIPLTPFVNIAKLQSYCYHKNLLAVEHQWILSNTIKRAVKKRKMTMLNCHCTVTASVMKKAIWWDVITPLGAISGFTLVV